MPSVASTARGRIELGLRLIGLALLAWALVRSHGLVPLRSHDRASSGDLTTQLDRWSSVAAPLEVRVRFDHSPTSAQRDWLAALKLSGTKVQWSADSLPPTAMSVEQGADPAGVVEIAMTAQPGALLQLRDTLGLRDTTRPADGIARFGVAGIEEGTAAVVQGAVAREVVRDSVRFRRLLLLGEASWDARFVAAALAERGWTVDARFAVAPGSDVYQGITIAAPAAPAPAPAAAAAPPRSFRSIFAQPEAQAAPQPAAPPPPPVAPRLRIDTSRYSAVIAIDSTAAREATAIARYLRDGGGVLLWPDAARTPAFRAVAPGGVGEGAGTREEGAVEARSREDLILRAVTPLHPDAVPLERSGVRVAVAARRIGAGRVLQVGYDDSWRWRMGGDSTAPEAYRHWVAGLVSRVALVGREMREVTGSDPAPFATLMARFGPATLEGSSTDSGHSPLPAWLLGLLVLLFLTEWTSRRTRGAP